MSLLQKSKTKASSRQQIDIEGVKDGILLLSRHRYRAALEVSSVNFELKSAAEQDALIETYESFLNSVGTSLQILVRTRAVDMDKYLSDLELRLKEEPEDVYRSQLLHYNEFIRSLITTNKILTRHFYVIVPYDAGSRTDFEQVSEHLQLSQDIVAKGLLRMGMHSRSLSSLELLDLFYSYYSPGQSKLQPLTEQTLQLVHSGYIRKETA